MAFYAAQSLIFADPKSTVFYILQDFAFLPISVLVVTLVLERLLETPGPPPASRETHGC